MDEWITNEEYKQTLNIFFDEVLQVVVYPTVNCSYPLPEPIAMFTIPNVEVRTASTLVVV